MTNEEEEFEEYWANAPRFSIPEEHERYKLVAKAAFMVGYLKGIRYKTKI